MIWLKKHADSIGVIAAIAIAVFWMTNQINGVESRLNDKLSATENRLNITINSLDKRLTVIETVMIMHGYNIKGIAANSVERSNEKK